MLYLMERVVKLLLFDQMPALGNIQNLIYFNRPFRIMLLYAYLKSLSK